MADSPQRSHLHDDAGAVRGAALLLHCPQPYRGYHPLVTAGLTQGTTILKKLKCGNVEEVILLYKAHPL